MLSEVVGHLPAIVFFLVVLSWIAFTLVFLTRKSPPKTPGQKRDSVSITGIVFQGMSFAIVWGFHLPYFTPLTNSNNGLTFVLSLLAAVMAFGSVLFIMTAIKTLGKEWSRSLDLLA